MPSQATTTQTDVFTNVPYAELPTPSIDRGGSSYLSDVRELNVGYGSQIFRADESGIWLGGKTFALATFSVSMAGDITASSFTLTGGTIKYGKTSFTDITHDGYFISSLGIYFGMASDATKFKFTIATGAMDLIGTVSSRSTATIAGAIDASGHFIDDRLDTSAKNILASFSFGVSGALQIGTYVNGVSGDVRISPNGIIARSSAGSNTFSLDGTTGAATFAGTLSAPDGNIGGWTISSTRLSAGSGSTAAGMATDGSIRFFAGSSTPSSAPFNVADNGDTRVNVLTNKAILFETVTAPAANDGQLWCANNASNQKVLWGYFGGDTTNKQQISMSRMFASGSRDNDNTGGGSTMTYDLEISTWFQPRSVEAKGFFVDSTANKIGVCYGFAQNGSEGVNTGLHLEFTAISNVVSGLSFSTNANAINAQNLTTNAAPQIPAAIDGGGHVTSYYNNANDLLIGTNWGSFTAQTGASWTNNSFSYVSTWAAFQQGDAILSENYNATRSNLNAYAYVLSWTDTKVTIRVVSKVGWRLFCQFNVIG